MQRFMRTPWPAPRNPSRWTHARRLLLCLGFWLMAGPAVQAQMLYIQSALTAPGSSPMFPDLSSAQRVTLPDEWARSRPGLDGPVWYRVEFPRLGKPESDDLMALWKVAGEQKSKLPTRAKSQLRAQLKPGKELGWSGGKHGT